MTRYTSFLTIIACFLLSFGLCQIAEAQKISKEEKRKIKEENKKLKAEVKGLYKNPARYKQMKTELKDYTEQANIKRKEIAEQSKLILELEEGIAKKEKAIPPLQQEIEALRKQIKEVDASNIATRYTTKGYVLSLQIGSYVRDKDLDRYMGESANFRVETYTNPQDNKSYKRYMLGFFPGNKYGYFEAEYFAKYLIKKMNISDTKYQPFVVGYKDGVFIEDIKANAPEILLK